MQQQAELLTVNETAAMLRFSAEHVRRLARAGTLPGVKVGDSWRFPVSEIKRLIAGVNNETPQERDVTPCNAHARVTNVTGVTCTVED